MQKTSGPLPLRQALDAYAFVVFNLYRVARPSPIRSKRFSPTNFLMDASIVLCG